MTLDDIAQLQEALRRREAEVAALQHIAMAVASAQDLADILQTIVHQAIEVIGCPKAAIFEADEKEGRLIIRAWQGLSAAYAEAARAVDLHSVRALAAQGGRPLTVPDVSVLAESEDAAALAAQEGYRAFADIPLRSRERILGILSVYYPEKHDFAPSEVEMLVSFADAAAIALETAHLLRDQQRRIDELASLEEIGRVISGTLDLPRLQECIYEQTSRLMDTGSFYIALYYEDSQEWEMALQIEEGQRQEVQGRQQLGAGLTGWIIRHREPLLLKRGATEFLKQQGITRIGKPSLSWLGVPILQGDQVLGVIAVQSYEREFAYDEEDLRILMTIAREAAVAYQNARALAEMRRLNEDLQRTLETQEQLIQTIRQLSTPVVPLLEGIILLPLIGHIDSERARQVMEQMLSGVQTQRARIVIVDITGVPVVDTMVAQALVQAAQAVRLLGAEAVLVGIMPEVAETIVGLGIDLTTLVTRANLQSGLEYALERLQRRG